MEHWQLRPNGFFWTLVNEGVIPNLPAMVVPASGTARTITEVAENLSALEYEAPTEEETYWIFAPTAYTNEQAGGRKYTTEPSGC